MPCNDLTEQIEIQLDDQQRLERYELFKRSCGKDVGWDETLAERLKGLSISELLELNAVRLMGDAAPLDAGHTTFLNFKHLFAIQAALQVWIGIAPGGPDSPCALAGVEHTDNGTLLRAQLDVDLVTANIIACGNCHGG
jgi:hypothetical protein